MPPISSPSRKTVLAATTGAAAVAAGAWWLGDRAPYPYARRRLLDLELPYLGLSDLDAVLRPRTGERMLNSVRAPVCGRCTSRRRSARTGAWTSWTCSRRCSTT